MTDGYVRAGSVIKTHGLKGGLKVYPTTDDPGRFDPGNKVWLDAPDGLMELTVKSCSPFKNIYILTFEEFSDINQVEGFRGLDILVERDDDALGANEFYIGDLIGLKVEDEEGKLIGTLKEVLVTKANDVYVVKTDDRELLIPAIPECILEVSPEDGLMRVHLLPGL